MKRLLEIRSYRLTPGSAAAFDEIMRGVCVPMLRAAGMDVVAFGPSLQEPDAYFLARAFRDLPDLTARQDAFYGSAPWREGPREAVVSRIETYLNTLLWLSDESIEDMRRNNA